MAFDYKLNLFSIRSKTSFRRVVRTKMINYDFVKANW